MAEGCEVTTVNNATFGGVDDAAYSLEATFDGGVREVRGARVGGVGAVLWGLDSGSGLRTRVAAASMALPLVADSQVVEAWGCTLSCCF